MQVFSGFEEGADAGEDVEKKEENPFAFARYDSKEFAVACVPILPADHTE